MYMSSGYPAASSEQKKLQLSPSPFSQTVLPEIVLTSKAHNLTLNSVLFSFRKTTSCTFR